VRYIRYAIKVNMGMENYGVAATFLELLIKYAKSNRAMLEQELQICEQHGRRDMVPAKDVRGVAIGVVAGRAYTEMVPHVSAARALAAKVGDRSGESRDCAILGLGYWSLERRKEAAQHLERAAELASASGGDVEELGAPERRAARASRLVSLALCYYSDGNFGRGQVTMAEAATLRARLPEDPGGSVTLGQPPQSPAPTPSKGKPPGSPGGSPFDMAEFGLR
jgi:hypothetical protein